MNWNANCYLARNPRLDVGKFTSNRGSNFRAGSRAVRACLMAAGFALILSSQTDSADSPRRESQEISMESARTDTAAAVISYAELKTRRLPRSTRKLLSKAIKLDKRGSTDEALLLVEKALRSAPAFVEAHTAAAIANLKLERLTEAQRHLDNALQIDATLPPAREVQGILLLREQRYAEARETLESVVERAPGRAMAHHYLGEALRALGEMELARRHEQMSQDLHDTPFRPRRDPPPLTRGDEGPAWVRP